MFYCLVHHRSLVSYGYIPAINRGYRGTSNFFQIFFRSCCWAVWTWTVFFQRPFLPRKEEIRPHLHSSQLNCESPLPSELPMAAQKQVGLVCSCMDASTSCGPLYPSCPEAVLLQDGKSRVACDWRSSGSLWLCRLASRRIESLGCLAFCKLWRLDDVYFLVSTREFLKETLVEPIDSPREVIWVEIKPWWTSA